MGVLDGLCFFFAVALVLFGAVCIAFHLDGRFGGGS